MDKIIIKDAYENNLKHIDLEIAINSFTCVIGCSGCGKSSLVYDTIYAESQRSFLEGMAGNIYNQKLMNKPKVGKIENLRPAINVSQNFYNMNPRSTLGTLTEISYYLRALFALVCSRKDIIINENIFSYNNPKCYCPNCLGLGVESVVSEKLLIPEEDKSLIEGGIVFFKGPPEGQQQKYLQALCEHYGIDVNKKVSQLTRRERDILLYSKEKIRYKIAYKEGKRRRQHYVDLQGVVSIINDKMSQYGEYKTKMPYSKYMEKIKCHVCGGMRLKECSLAYQIAGLNYADVENMELFRLYAWLKSLGNDNVEHSKRVDAFQIINTIIDRLEVLLSLNVGHLCLNRSVTTLSGGEIQRIRIAKQLNCSLKDIIYILDEPCKGLHFRDVKNIIWATRQLVNDGNTVIAIEHNRKYIDSSDYVIELGPVGGPAGGYILSYGSKRGGAANKFCFKKACISKKFLELNDIVFRNVIHQNVTIPVGAVTCITGVSGSGKTTLMEVIYSCISSKTNMYCAKVDGVTLFKRVTWLNQSPIGKTSRSTVASYLEIFDEMRDIFSKTTDARQLKMSASFFSMNVKGGRCECCQGTGYQKIELNYLPSSYIICQECNGKRFNEDVLSVKYKGHNIQEILDAPICDIIDLFSENRKIYSILFSMVELGLSYIKLGQMSMNLSGGEAQRVKLAKALGRESRGNNLYLLDEPTSGLNDKDIEKFERVLEALHKRDETIIMIEHNMDFIARNADYVIDLGLKSGMEGGKIISEGVPESVFENKKTSLYGYTV